MTAHAVVIAGGGPAGLMLAGELALAGVDVAIVERRTRQDLAGSRAGGLHARALEVLDQRGIADRFISQGQAHPVVHFHVPLSLSDFPTRHNYTLGLWQNHIERLLAEWVSELRVPIYRGCEVTGFTQDDTGVDVALSEAVHESGPLPAEPQPPQPRGPEPPAAGRTTRSLRAEYLVGCDGGRSRIRKSAGIEFAGWDPTVSWLIAEAEMGEEPKWGFHHDAAGSHAIGKVENGPRVRVVLTEAQLRRDAEPTLRDVSAALIGVFGTDFGIHSPTWISRFNDMTRQAVAYRERRVLLAGDAAHVHPPVGGQGLNIGVQDAVNLGWKLAQVVKRISPATLLDTYHAERHPVAARVLRNTMAQVALRRPDERSKALGEILSDLLALDEPRRKLAAMMSGLDVHYDIGHSDTGERHPLLGRRMPDLELHIANEPVRLFTLLHDARPVLLHLAPARVDISPWSDRVRTIDATCTDQWQLPVIGAIPAPRSVLIRPDGYVAWVETSSAQGLEDALLTWFGPPTAA